MKIYTQQELEEMVDADLNKTAGILSGAVRTDCNYAYYKMFCPQYCSNWGAVGVLIDECRINTRHSSSSRNVYATNWGESCISRHTNAKRAITIVYILIKQAK